MGRPGDPQDVREFRPRGSSPRTGLDDVAQSRCPQYPTPLARTGSPESTVDAGTMNQDHPNNPLDPIHRDNPTTLFAPLTDHLDLVASRSQSPPCSPAHPSWLLWVPRQWPTGEHLRGAPLAQLPCPSRCVILSGTPALASASRVLRALCVGSPLPVREPPSFQHRRTHEGDQHTTREHAVMRQHQRDDLAECQRDGAVLRNDLLPAVQGSVRCVAQWDLVRSQ